MAKKNGKKGVMLLKVDLAKAYDRIDWGFLENTLKAAGIPDICLSMIMECVTSMEMQVLWNGGETASFKPTRGLRQGCPLSPYLFTLCIERLSHCIMNEVKSKCWKPVKIAPHCPELSHLFFADDLVLFAEASCKQADIIMRCVDSFCHASGELISKNKSRVFFSKNTRTCDRQNICARLGIQSTPDLGRYLGVPVLHGRLSKVTFRYILENMDRRLSLWKARTLSLAGRVTLAMSVLNAIPSYAMQTSFLPLSICDAIDQKIRSFVWGSSEGKRKVHLISWDKVCKPKNQGGLGLRSARNMNLAYMVKLAWNLFNNEEDLWVKVLQGKYFHHKDGRIHKMKKSNHSSLWKGIVKAMPFMKQATLWSPRDGETTGFWTQPWVANGLILQDFASSELSEEEQNASVASWVDDSGEWDWERLRRYLPDSLINLIAGIEAPRAGSGEDKTVWGIEKDGRFRLKSAYSMVAGELESSPVQLWKDLWSWKGPSRIKHFLWLASHERLMTNTERERRKMTENKACNHCTTSEETTEHILRGCSKASSIWRHFHDKLVENDNTMDFRNWLNRNLKEQGRGIDFGIVCWSLWKQRNEEVMDGKTFSEAGLISRINAWININKQATSNVQKSLLPMKQSKSAREIAWKPPREGWIQVQTDGSVIQPSGRAAAGGLLRDHLGRCLGAFSSNLGACSITRAELRAAVEGLEMAWKLGHRRVELNLDSTTALNIIKNRDQTDHCHGAIADYFGELLSREWNVEMKHIFRECNFAADFLANKGHSLSFGSHLFNVSDPNLCYWLFYDNMGISRCREVNEMI
ncbi:unnamed protein product [Linum trigynum]|uniref:Uncharacterized protein n=1 Tax=Linum trigynum TaxID=586398 RepID=A0AAV2GRH8_9ROSI